MLVLASSSPRRRELLAQGGFTFQVTPAAIPEERRPDESAISYVTRLAREKAEAVWGRSTNQGHERLDREDDPLLVLGADTTVVAADGQILEKPTDERDAARMLRLLSGTTHKIITGVALISASGSETAAEITYVTMLTLSDAEIAEYISTGESMDKAGAYGIQGRAARWVPRVHGCYFNVMGLPLALVSSMIEGANARARNTAAEVTSAVR
jgi:septum formation protein